MHIQFYEYFRDCWYLYALNPLDKYLSGRLDTEPDQTIEILMTDLDPKVMALFTKNRVKTGPEATKVHVTNFFSLLQKRIQSIHKRHVFVFRSLALIKSYHA